MIIRLSEIYQYCSLKMKLCTNSVNIHFIQLCFYHKVACFFLLIFQFPSSALWRGFNSANKLMVCARRLILSILFSLRFTSQATILCIFFSFDNPNNLGAPHQPERSTGEPTGYKKIVVIFLCCVQSLYN